MAAEWYYIVNGQQSAAVELDALRQMIDGGTLARSELVFGPGLSQWMPAAQVPALSGGAAAPVGEYPPAGASMLGIAASKRRRTDFHMSRSPRFSRPSRGCDLSGS